MTTITRQVDKIDTRMYRIRAVWPEYGSMIEQYFDKLVFINYLSRPVPTYLSSLFRKLVFFGMSHVAYSSSGIPLISVKVYILFTSIYGNRIYDKYIHEISFFFLQIPERY